MQTASAHVSTRLAGRVAPCHRHIADALISQAPRRGNVAIVCHVPTVQSRKGSNGDNLVLIVRNGVLVTIMYCRTNQINTNHLRVHRIDTVSIG
jgi:hypothetical protein